MAAALHYSTAWIVPVLFSSLLLLVRPISRVGDIARWGWHPSQYALDVTAGMVAAVSFVLWWFWLLRLGWAAPAGTRGRVEWFFGLGVPLILGSAAAAWWFGLEYGLTHLFELWKLRF
jgi:hypothetical protein